MSQCKRREENQLDATEWFIALIICSTYFGHFYAYHQKLDNICVLLPPMVCSAVVAGCRKSGAEQQTMSPVGRVLLEQVPQTFWAYYKWIQWHLVGVFFSIIHTVV
jgi:hypothetical protein